jgi:hypothetical protein
VPVSCYKRTVSKTVCFAARNRDSSAGQASALLAQPDESGDVAGPAGVVAAGPLHHAPAALLARQAPVATAAATPAATPAAPDRGHGVRVLGGLLRPEVLPRAQVAAAPPQESAAAARRQRQQPEPAASQEKPEAAAEECQGFARRGCKYHKSLSLRLTTHNKENAFMHKVAGLCNCTRLVTFYLYF